MYTNNSKLNHTKAKIIEREIRNKKKKKEKK